MSFNDTDIILQTFLSEGLENLAMPSFLKRLSGKEKCLFYQVQAGIPCWHPEEQLTSPEKTCNTLWGFHVTGPRKR